VSNRRLFYSCFLVISILWIIHPSSSFADPRLSAYETMFLTYINQYRIANGLNRLSADESLTILAERHSTYMQGKNVLSHEHFDERFRQSRRSLCVENVGWNYPTPETQFRAWKNSRDHNANLLNKRIKHAGISKVGSYVTFFACN
jgi:uncharacterized protein YkwD